MLGGERALRRELWERLPEFYKHRFRVEAGLNFFARYWGNDFAYKVYPGLTQTIKEKKYGLWRGLRQRLGMTADILTAQFALMRFHAPATVKYQGKLFTDMLWSGAGLLAGMTLLIGIHLGSYRLGKLLVSPYFAEHGLMAAMLDFALQTTRALGLEMTMIIGALLFLINAVIFVFSLHQAAPLWRNTYERRKATR